MTSSDVVEAFGCLARVPSAKAKPSSRKQTPYGQGEDRREERTGRVSDLLSMHGVPNRGERSYRIAENHWVLPGC
ncbi:hypothetical protein QLX08_001682 [Tetragonisca angustula]|uniref:Uncharacterized protein n=1 Tax=Tetragonisca angustula TaxID=166442 RepID=A0AAW1AGL1_9HYME